MKSGSKSVPFALAFPAQKLTRSFQRFALIRTTQAQLSSPSWRRIQPAGQALETLKALRIEVLPGSNLSGELGAEVIFARNKTISARAKELRVLWTTKPTQIIEVKNRK